MRCFDPINHSLPTHFSQILISIPGSWVLGLRDQRWAEFQQNWKTNGSLQNCWISNFTTSLKSLNIQWFLVKMKGNQSSKSLRTVPSWRQSSCLFFFLQIPLGLAPKRVIMCFSKIGRQSWKFHFLPKIYWKSSLYFFLEDSKRSRAPNNKPTPAIGVPSFGGKFPQVLLPFAVARDDETWSVRPEKKKTCLVELPVNSRWMFWNTMKFNRIIVKDFHAFSEQFVIWPTDICIHLGSRV